MLSPGSYKIRKKSKIIVYDAIARSKFQPLDAHLLSQSFTSSAGGEKRASHAATSERQIERSMEKKELGLSKRTSLSLPKESSDVVTPIPDRMQARVSGVFSDDNSPCIESRRTIVFTAFKQKRSLIKGLQELSKSRGHFDIAKEVSHIRHRLS